MSAGAGSRDEDPLASVPSSSEHHVTRGSQQVDWLDDDEMLAWRSMVDVNLAVQAAIETDLAPHGLSAGEYGVLVRLSEAPDRRLRMCDLAEGLHLSPSGMTRRLDGLVKAGLVERQPSAEDRRVMLAVLTQEGFARLDRAAPDHVRSVRRHFIDHLSRSQLRNLGIALRTVADGESERHRSDES